MHEHGRRRHFNDLDEKKNDKSAVKDESVALHHLAGIADQRRDRHAGKQSKHTLNFLIEEKDEATQTGRPVELHWLRPKARNPLCRCYGATRSSSLCRRRSVKDPGVVLDIASQIQANGYDIERSEISRIETRSDCLMSCVSQVQQCCAALSC